MRRLSSLLLFLTLVLLCVPLHAQTVDTAIVGTVTDNSGAVIPGANVTVSSVATGIEKKAVTANSGEYSVTYLSPGTYLREAGFPNDGKVMEATAYSPGLCRGSRTMRCEVRFVCENVKGL